MPVAFALTCIVLTIVAFIAFGGSTPFAPEGYRVTIPLQQASNLVPGSGVEVAGVTVGRVIAVTRAGNSARAEIQLPPAFTPLRTGATAIERTKTLLGEGYIELAPGSRVAPAIPDGGTLAATHVQPTVALDQFISTFGPTTRRRLHSLFSGLAGAFGSTSTALNDSLGRAAPLTANLGAVLGTLQHQSSELGRLIDTSGQVLNAVGTREGALHAAVTNGAAVVSTTARRNRGLAATIAALPAFLTQLHQTADTVTAASPALTSAVNALEPIAPLLAPTLEQINRAAPQFRGLFNDLPATLTAGKQSLPSLTRIVRAVEPALHAFYPAARNLIPFMQLFAANNQIIDIIANVGAVTSGSYVGPGGLVLGAASGVVSVWNETISGWAHKLPTNRQEPYPKPGALLETGQIGVLKSYDCRNTHNPPWLPATGTGAPPCLLQGPWTFDGKTAYYPRLTLDPP